MHRRPLFSDLDGDPLPRRSRSGSEVDIDITPMIDVTFLLLIFFMVSSTMKATPDLDVPPAKYGVAVPTEAATIISVRAPEAEAGPVILLGDGAGPVGDLGDGETGVRRYVEKGVGKNVHQVIIKADREVPYGFVQEVARGVMAVEGVRFSIGVRDRRE